MKKDKYINIHLEKIEKGVVDIMIATVVDQAVKDLQPILDLLPDVSSMYPNAKLNNIKDKTGLGIGIILPEEEDK